jgi:serine/threonine protein kinase
LDESGSSLSVDTACSIGKQIIDSYEYIHSKGYVHKDCKGSNILFVNRAAAPPEVTSHTPAKKICLVDYGLVSKYIQEGGVHKPYGIDERSAHEGTLEYTSRDVHLGCVSRRGDIEVLFYCLVEWLGGKLPWDQPQQPHPKDIHKMKLHAFQNTDEFLQKAFSEKPDDMKVPPTFLKRMMTYLDNLKFEERPDYDFLRSIFQRRIAGPTRSRISLSSLAYSSEDEEVNLAISIRNRHHNNHGTLVPPQLPIPLSSLDSNDETDDEVVLKTQIRHINGRMSERPRTPRTRQMDEANIEQRIEDERQAKQAENMEVELTRASEDRFQKERNMYYHKLCIKSLKNPTPIMLEQLSKIQERNQEFQRSLSEIIDSPFRRSKFVTVGSKRARSRSLILYDEESTLKTPKRYLKETDTPRSLPCKKLMQRRKSGAVKRLFNQSPSGAANGSSSTKKLRRSRRSGKSISQLVTSLSSSPKSVSRRRRHRSGPNKEVAFSISEELIQHKSKCNQSINPPFRRNKRCIPIIPIEKDKRPGFRHNHMLQDFSSFFNKALTNVTKSILRYNSKS